MHPSNTLWVCVFFPYFCSGSSAAFILKISLTHFWCYSLHLITWRSCVILQALGVLVVGRRRRSRRKKKKTPHLDPSQCCCVVAPPRSHPNWIPARRILKHTHTHSWHKHLRARVCVRARGLVAVRPTWAGHVVHLVPGRGAWRRKPRRSLVCRREIVEAKFGGGRAAEPHVRVVRSLSRLLAAGCKRLELFGRTEDQIYFLTFGILGEYRKETRLYSDSDQRQIQR